MWQKLMLWPFRTDIWKCRLLFRNAVRTTCFDHPPRLLWHVRGNFSLGSTNAESIPEALKGSDLWQECHTECSRSTSIFVRIVTGKRSMDPSLGSWNKTEVHTMESIMADKSWEVLNTLLTLKDHGHFLKEFCHFISCTFTEYSYATLLQNVKAAISRNDKGSGAL
jgi:hypothetical protein